MDQKDWKSTIAVTIGFTIILFFGTFVWNLKRTSSSTNTINLQKKKKRNIDDNQAIQFSEEDDIFSTQEFRWIKVGRVEELYYYPLKSGRGKSLQECNFIERGISVERAGCLTLQDRMFLVYHEETCRFQTGRNYPTLILVGLSAVDELKVKLEAVGMPSLVFNVPIISSKNTKAIVCTMWWGEQVECIDCGPKPAEWLSRFLTGTNSGVRLGRATYQKRILKKGPWERFIKVYDTIRNDDTGLFSDLASYMLMTSDSLENLNNRLEKPVSSLQFRPNMVIKGPEAFKEDEWGWIKIGERVILRNVKPCPRCSMISVDPETGQKNHKEPMMTLKSFRAQTNPLRISVDGKSPTMGIYCGLYASGMVKVDNDVFVHITNGESLNEITHDSTPIQSQTDENSSIMN